MSTLVEIKRLEKGIDVAAAFTNNFHSYIKWSDRPSRKLYWLIYEDGKHVGVFALGSAFVRNKQVADWAKANGNAFNEIANNIVFCLHGQIDRNLGSRALSLLRRDAVTRWKERYGDTLKAFQTFILPPRNGAVYRADNWQELGMTTGNSFAVRTLRRIEFDTLPPEKKVGVEERKFKGGETKFLLREAAVTPSKIILVRKAGFTVRKHVAAPLEDF